MKIFYLTGPADITKDYDAWKSGSEHTSFGGGIFICQYFQLCEELEADSVLISTKAGSNTRRGRQQLVFSPAVESDRKGLAFHWQSFRNALGHVMHARAFRPDLMLLTSGFYYWSVFLLAPRCPVGIVPFFHISLWPKSQRFHELSSARRLLLKGAVKFLQKRATGILSITDTIERQIKEIQPDFAIPIFRYVPVYEASLFERIDPPRHQAERFNVLFVGRTSRPKGIYELLQIALKVQQEDSRVQFEVCGTSPDFEEVKGEFARKGVANVVFHGQCDRAKLTECYSRSHAVIIPNPSEGWEGFIRVSIESVLSGRPVILSSGALEPEVDSACLAIEPGDIDGYVAAILKLFRDASLYEEKHRAAKRISPRFLSGAEEWTDALFKACPTLRQHHAAVRGTSKAPARS